MHSNPGWSGSAAFTRKKRQRRKRQIFRRWGGGKRDDVGKYTKLRNQGAEGKRKKNRGEKRRHVWELRLEK